MTLRELQHRAVDTIKQHALVLAIGSRRAESYILTEYLWAEEGTEQTALHRAIEHSAAPPTWLLKLIEAQLADEHRHARLLRGRLGELGIAPHPAPALARVKLWWLERACVRYLDAFAAGPVVVLLGVAAQLEATGARVLGRHLAVMEQRAPLHPTTSVLRSIVADERRHARSCAAAAERLVRADERAAFDALRERVGVIDRSFGTTLAVRYWLKVAALVALDRITPVSEQSVVMKEAA